ncbi:efflux RND transporter periplasmic adaptor subunit [Immundisolibacter sp.]|uniref:efflux RND transporter periplasmic adaptor subunit n=1 Tax=Immundisolibacter sp. TaxID=1934948 RepID=UPI00356261F7
MTDHPSLSRRRILFGALIIVILVSSVATSRYLLNSAPVAERKPPQRVARLVAASTLQRDSERVQITAFGTVEAAQRSTLAARVSGEVIGISEAFVPGSRVSKGTELLTLDPADYEMAVAEAEAALASARASLAQEQGNQAVARADAEILNLDVSDEERRLMLREPQLRSARAAAESAQVALVRARLNLSRTTIRAPFDGVVLSRDVALGSQVAANSGSVGELVAATPYWLTLRVPIDSLRWIEWPDADRLGGSRVEVVDAGDPHSPVWEGRVIQLLDELESEGRRAGVLVEVAEPFAAERPLLLGTYARATIHGRELVDAFRLDNTWIHDGGVWKVVEDRLVMQPVEITFAASDHALVTQGLGDGDRIVTSQPSGFVDGMRVRVQGDAPRPPGDAAPDQRPAPADRGAVPGGDQ